MSESKIKQDMPILPLRDVAVFPSMVLTLFAGREKSIASINKSIDKDKKIFLVAQKEAKLTEPKKKDLYEYGVCAKILQHTVLDDESVKILVEGRLKAKLLDFNDDENYSGKIELLGDYHSDVDPDESAAWFKVLDKGFRDYIELNDLISEEMAASLKSIIELDRYIDLIAMHIPMKIAEKQKFLEEISVEERVKLILVLLKRDLERLKVEKKISVSVKKAIDDDQRHYIEEKRLDAIKKELSGNKDPFQSELRDLEKKIKALKMKAVQKDRVLSEFKKLKMVQPMSSEASVIRHYLEWVVDLPWGQHSKINRDLEKAQATLHEDHHGLKDVKERILEYLAVHIRSKSTKGPILCLVGPPGVGKTSLGTSIAKATGRKYVRIALGGIHDEAEIRGHRKTYIGSMPGRIIKALKKTNTSNPLILLDEVDKLGIDSRGGDPASALLEVLDPEQNHTFNDHYIELDYDLSQVMFVTTANSLDMPQPLLDRMERIYLSGYTEQEKTHIVTKHLWPKILKENALKDNEIKLTAPAILHIIRYYTREAGVRDLTRCLHKISRKTVRQIVASDTQKTYKITSSKIKSFLGPQKHDFESATKKDQIGQVRGLAWTQAGGDLLSIEVLTTPGKGKVISTGQLGDVMKESVQAALSLVKVYTQNQSIEASYFSDHDIHVHVPEGAIPKDGPSAGITIATAILSVVLQKKVKACVAMTGEITLRGDVLPIGGLKEKLLAAVRGKIKTVLIPKDNEKDLVEVPKEAKNALTIIPVSRIETVWQHALVSPLKPVEH